jgi:phage recombination protein Bet
MSNTTEEKPEAKKKVNMEERSMSYVPLGATEKMELKYNFVRDFLATPTKSGKLPSNGDIIKFMMLCSARALNPWEGDAYLLGYDSNDGPVFSLITAIQALLKRSELCEEFDGIESGVIVKSNGELTERMGTMVMDDEVLIGGWARCYRKDRKVPFYQSVQLRTYDTQRSRWGKDKPGMIQKIAKAAVLREAFPNHLAGLYTREEMDTVEASSVSEAKHDALPAKVKTTADLAKVLEERNAPKALEVKPLTMYETYLAEIAQNPTGDAAVSIEADVMTDKTLSDEQKESLVDMLHRKSKLVTQG